MSKVLSFRKLRNIRDLGGMKTADGRQIREGKLIRCGHLSRLDPEDLETVQSMVDIIVDFRSDGERQENPDSEMAGVEHVSIPILDRLTAGITREEEADRDVFVKFLAQPAGAKKYMCGMYRAFVSDYAVSGYAKFLRILLESGNRTVLWHCTAGKDRAGIASALVEEILGVPREDIIRDYVRTNEYLEDDIVSLTEFIKKQAGIGQEESGAIADEALRYLFGADEDYIKTYYAAVEERFGTTGRFIREGLGLTDAELESLKMRYLV